MLIIHIHIVVISLKRSIFHYLSIDHVLFSSFAEALSKLFSFSLSLKNITIRENNKEERHNSSHHHLPQKIRTLD